MALAAAAAADFAVHWLTVIIIDSIAVRATYYSVSWALNAADFVYAGSTITAG